MLVAEVMLVVLAVLQVGLAVASAYVPAMQSVQAVAPAMNTGHI